MVFDREGTSLVWPNIDSFLGFLTDWLSWWWCFMSPRRVWGLGHGRREAGMCAGVHVLREETLACTGELQVSLSPLGGSSASEKGSTGSRILGLSPVFSHLLYSRVNLWTPQKPLHVSPSP